MVFVTPHNHYISERNVTFYHLVPSHEGWWQADLCSMCFCSTKKSQEKPKEVLKTTDPYQGNSRSLSDQSPSLEQWNHLPKSWNIMGSWTFTKSEFTKSESYYYQKKPFQNPNAKWRVNFPTVKANAVNPAVLLIFLQQNCCH